MKVYTQSAQLIKYMFTGGLTTGVNYLIYFILLGAAGDAAQQSRVYLAANSAAWLGAVLFAYVMNRKLVFHSERAIVHEFWNSRVCGWQRWQWKICCFIC